VRRKFLILAPALWLGLAAAAQTPAPASRSLYAVNAAAIATAMTYCIARHGPLRVGSPGAACFGQARNMLAGYGLRQVAEKIDALCRDPASFNTCLTPEIGRLVNDLNAELQKRSP